MPGACVLREDDCTTAGTPYQKARAWFSTCWGIASTIASVCQHPLPHPERLEGQKTSRSAIYPFELATKYVEGLISELQNTGSLTNETVVASAKLHIEYQKKNDTLLPFPGPFEAWVETGRSKVAQVRHGRRIGDIPPKPKESDKTDPVKAAVATPTPLEFERAELARLQRADPEFADIFEAMKSMDAVTAKHGDATTTDMIFAHLRSRLADTAARSRAKRADAAVQALSNFVVYEELLYRKVLDPHTNSFVERAVLPAGGLRAFWYNGRRYKLSLRKEMLLMHHDSELAGAHSSAKGTLAKISLIVWRPSMEQDVQQWFGSCSVCRLAKPQPGLTAEQRRELHGRPFRILFMDAMGPIRPPSDGNEIIFHVECPFSRWPWIKAVPADTADEWAKFLVEEVFFDLAGFPAVLRSDRGKAFLSEVVRAVNDYLGVVQAFGSSYHPESQGYLEARHKPINNVLAAYCRQFPGQWSRWIKLAQWAMRSTPRADRCGKSPYEIVTGLIPQGPIDELFAKHANTRFVDPGSYVAALHENLEHIHTCVREQLEAELENKHAKAERDGVPQVPAKVGDMVFLRRPPPELQRGEVSKRFLPKANPQFYRVQKLVSAQAVILEDPDTHSTDLGFAQPIAISRLILFDMQDLEAPVSTQQDLSLELWGR